jgi:hypothetical protein
MTVRYRFTLINTATYIRVSAVLSMEEIIYISETMRALEYAKNRNKEVKKE